VTNEIEIESNIIEQAMKHKRAFGERRTDLGPRQLNFVLSAMAAFGKLVKEELGSDFAVIIGHSFYC